MPFSTDFADEGIDVGDDKTLVVVPRGPDGNATTASDLTLTTKKPDGTTETKAFGDFSQEGKTYAVDVRHDQVGLWRYRLESVGWNGRQEAISFSHYVQEKYG